MTEHHAASETPDLDAFINRTEFSGYQRITLPGGRVIPGADRSPTADLVFPADLTGKSVLDVGCFYGFFLHDAVRRGARRAVGIEADPERFRIASTLAPLWDGKIEVREGLLEQVELNEKFDVVLFLNVLHHVRDPLEVMRRLAGLCRGTLIIEFRQPHDPQFVQECLHGPIGPSTSKPSLLRRLARGATIAIEAPIMELVTSRLPIIGVGSVEYHRSYFFSRAGFRNTFVVHNRLFKSVEFRPSLTRGQAMAFCDCSE
jgi:SAM-dependent methyltransferase